MFVFLLFILMFVILGLMAYQIAGYTGIWIVSLFMVLNFYWTYRLKIREKISGQNSSLNQNWMNRSMEDNSRFGENLTEPRIVENQIVDSKVISSVQNFCENCGSALIQGLNFCEECGARISDQN